MDYKLKVYTIWNAGIRDDNQGMPNQEDCIYPPYGEQNEADRLFIVCDGMGGHDSGEVASAVVCDALKDSIFSSMRRTGGVFDVETFARALEYAYQALDSNDTHEPRKMGTTMALLKLYDEGYLAAHIGDCRIYHIRPGANESSTQFIYRSEDHSVVASKLRRGEISEQEAMVSPERNVITRTMQPHTDHRFDADVEIYYDVKPGDYFFVCSHGMLENMDDRYIRYVFSQQGGNARNKYNMLVKATAGNYDNHSAFIIYIEDVIGADATNWMLRATIDTDVDTEIDTDVDTDVEYDNRDDYDSRESIPGDLDLDETDKDEITNKSDRTGINDNDNHDNDNYDSDNYDNDNYDNDNYDPLTDPESSINDRVRMHILRERGMLSDKAHNIISYRPGDKAWSKLGRILFGLMIIMTVVMIVYYLFFHHNETPPRAGYAVDEDTRQEEYRANPYPEETYGYEAQPSTYIEDNTDATDENAATEPVESAATDDADTRTPQQEETAPVTAPTPTHEPEAQPQQHTEPQRQMPVVAE